MSSSRPGSSVDALKGGGQAHLDGGEQSSGPKGIMDHQAFNVTPLNIGTSELLDTLYYPDEHILKPVIPGELDRDRLATTFTLGFPAPQRQSFCFVSPSVIAFPSGNAVSFLNVVTMEQQLLPGPRCGGIVAVAVHPDTAFIAIAERHPQGPNIYIYSYPELRLYRVLRGGADLSFSHLTFSQADGGAYLASAASDPDYTLTVWDWRKERVVLRAKAFSQDLFHVAFSPINPLAIITSGVGHIKFWKMASTFTGLKLQGLLGKFGATELTDIPCFIVLPSGKVLSATDSGILLLWDGNFIQCEVSGRLGKKCHQGAIEFIAVEDGDVITAGEDGFIRTWDLEAIEGPEPTEGKSPTATTVFEQEPLDELFVGKDVKIKCMRRMPVDAASAKASKASATAAAAAGVDYLAADGNGALWRINLKTRTSERIWSFPSGPIHAIDTCPSAVHHLVISAGQDGTVRVNDPLTRSPLAIARHSVPATCIKYLPRSLDVLGCSLVAGFADGSIRFFRHAVPTPGKSSITIARTHALRPHASAVVSLVLSSDATVLATANEHGDVFFFLVRNVGITFDRTTSITPIGFLSLGIPIRSLTWGLDPQAKSTSNRVRGRYLVVVQSGDTLVLTINLEKQYERDHNFVIPETDYEVAPWTLQKYGEVAVTLPTAMLISAGDRPTTPGGGVAKPKSPPVAEGHGNTDGSEQGKDKDANATAPSGPPPLVHQVTQALYFEQDHFVCAIESSNGTTEIRSCLLGDSKISRLLLTLHNHTSVTYLGISPTLKALLIGCHDGTVYYRPVSFDGDLNLSNAGGHETLLLSDEYFWRSHVHAGSVVGFRATFDDAIFVSAGADGSIFVIKSAVDDLVQRALSTDGMVLPTLEDADDLPNKYTIQEAKMMLRIDEENTLADQRKLARKSIIRELQRQLDAIRSENAMLPAALQLPEEALHVDPQLKCRIAEETAAKVEKAKNQLLWQSEKIALLLRKLKQRFHDPVASYVVTVEGFQNGLNLNSFRTEKIECQELKPMSPQAQHLRPGQQLSPVTQAESKHKQVVIARGEAAMSPQATVASKSNGGEGKTDTSKQAQSKAQARMDQNARLEDRRRIKNERIEQWKQLMAGKPSPTSEDPRDAAAIRYAETHMGDYKLKRDKSYIVPENERVNAEMKHKQIALLQASLVRIMEAFNGKVQALLKRKQQLVQEMEARQRQLAAAQSALGSFGSAARRNMSDITSTEVSREHLSSQDQLERNTHIQRLEHLILRLNKANQDTVAQFDATLASLCRERLSIATDIKSGEIRLLLLFQEWKLLKEFEKHDTRLSEKLATKKAEKTDIDVKIQDIQAKIVEKRNEIERAMDARKSLEAKLTETIGESSKFEEVFVKIFRKKIKRRRRKENQAQQGNGEEGGDGNAPEEEEDEEDESEDESESDEDTGDEAVSDDCPQGCDGAVHKAVLALREKRLDLEESLADVQKSVDALKKDHDIFSKKEKVISAALRQTEQEIQEFQSQKQQKLNELDVVVPLAFHQIQYFEDSLEDALVFPHDGLDHLRHRIVETEEETEQVHKDHKELKREHVTLLSIRKEKRAKLAEFESKCTEVQMLKFGRIVDLDRLEKMGINKAAEDLRAQIAEKERQQARELEAWDHKISEMKKKLTAAVVENTKQLEAIYELTVKRKALEQALDTEQTAVLSQYGGPSRQEIEEQNRLISTVQRQAQEIEELKVELTDLLRKPGPVVPPILPKGKGRSMDNHKSISSTTLPPVPREQSQAQAPPPMIDSRTSSAQ